MSEERERSATPQSLIVGTLLLVLVAAVAWALFIRREHCESCGAVVWENNHSVLHGCPKGPSKIPKAITSQMQ